MRANYPWIKECAWLKVAAQSMILSKACQPSRFARPIPKPTPKLLVIADDSTAILMQCPRVPLEAHVRGDHPWCTENGTMPSA